MPQTTTIHHKLRISKAEQRAIALEKAEKVGRVDVRGLAACLGMAWPTAKDLINSGRILSFTFGRRQIVTYSELQRFLTEGPVYPPIPPHIRHESDDDATY